MLANKNRAFTLIELIVGLSIASMLIALSLPAVQKSREVMRDRLCGTRLRELALACHQFETTHTHLPTGYVGPVNDDYSTPSDSSWAGSNLFLLSTLGVASEGISKFADGPTWWDAGTVVSTNLRNVTQSQHAVFRCPSDMSANPGDEVIVGSYIRETNGSAYRFGKHSATIGGAANFFGNMGFLGEVSHPWINRLRGPFFNRSKTRFSDFRDGLSHTILYGEGTGEWVDAEKKSGRISFLHWCGGPLSTRRPGVMGTGHYTSFSSLHTSGVNFTFGDGSQRSVSISVDRNVLRALGSMAGNDTCD